MTAAVGTTMGEISGIPVLHVDKPGPTKATLYVGAGWADETFASRGVTHTVEHLVMHGTTRGRFEANASVTMYRTGFWANGRPEQVGRFLNEVAAGIRDLPLDRLDHEARVLQAEAGEPGYGPHDAMLKARYGHQGPGLAMFWGSGPLATAPETVMEHARRWFVRGNAVLAVVGPMPDDLDLALPEGEMPSRTFTEVSRPGLVTFDVQDPVLSFVVPDGVAARAVVGAMGSRLEEELRHGNGDVYGVAAEVVRLPGTGTLLVQLAAKSGPGAAGTVAEAMVRELEHRVRTGVSADELEEMLEWWDAADSDPDEVGDLEMEAERLLSGLPPLTFAEARAEAAALDPADVAAMMGGVSASTLLLVPRDVEPATSLPVGASCSTSETMTTAPLRRRFRSKAPRGVALGFDGELVELRDQDGDVHRVRLEDVVGVGVDGSARELVGRGGCFVTVDPRDFAGADAVVRAIDARVPAGLHFDLAAYFAGT